jgi:hypothetical protein|nr:MAG TPA: chromosome segregation protein [Caudoviricetes sp.]
MEMNDKMSAALENLCEADNLDNKIRLLDDVTDIVVEGYSEPCLDKDKYAEAIDLLNAVRDLRKSLTEIRSAL